MWNPKQPITDPVTADCCQILRSASRLEQQSDVDGLSAQWDARGGEYDIESDLKGINETAWQNGPGSVNAHSENRAEPRRSPVRLCAEGFPVYSLSAIHFCWLCSSLVFPSVGTEVFRRLIQVKVATTQQKYSNPSKSQAIRICFMYENIALSAISSKSIQEEKVITLQRKITWYYLFMINTLPGGWMRRFTLKLIIANLCSVD